MAKATSLVNGMEGDLRPLFDRVGDFGNVRFESEVSRLEEADDGTRDVVLERLGALRQEERIVLAPRGQQRRLVGPEVLLYRIERYVAFVVAEQIQLDFVPPGSRHVEIVEGIAVG